VLSTERTTTYLLHKYNIARNQFQLIGEEKNKTTETRLPTLNHVPSYPFCGSIISQLLSGIPKTALKAHEFRPEMRKRYGDYFTWGIPGSGSTLDSKGTLHVL
jgi:hypothetical protein